MIELVWPNRATALDTSLERLLFAYTLALEARYAGRRVVEDLSAC